MKSTILIGCVPRETVSIENPRLPRKLAVSQSTSVDQAECKLINLQLRMDSFFLKIWTLLYFSILYSTVLQLLFAGPSSITAINELTKSTC